MHFFDESSVVKTSGTKQYGHAPVCQIAVEIQRYAPNATYTVNLLHSTIGVSNQCNTRPFQRFGIVKLFR